VHNATVRAVLYAKSLKAKHIGGLFFAADPEDVESIQGQWAEWDMDIALTSIDAPFRDISGPLLEEVRRDTTHKDSIVTVVLPELVVSRWWELPLHNQVGLYIKRTLLFEPNVVVTSVPFHLRGSGLLWMSLNLLSVKRSKGEEEHVGPIHRSRRGWRISR